MSLDIECEICFAGKILLVSIGDKIQLSLATRSNIRPQSIPTIYTIITFEHYHRPLPNPVDSQEAVSNH